MYKSKVQVISANAITMALYLGLSILVAPISSGIIQFRISESLNHLVVFNRKLMWGILLGVITFNLFFGFGVLDAIFGGVQTFIALGATALIQNKVKNLKIRLVLNTVFFTVTMFIIAYMLVPSGGKAFWTVYASLAISECLVMVLSAPLLFWMNKVVHFDKKL